MLLLPTDTPRGSASAGERARLRLPMIVPSRPTAADQARLLAAICVVLHRHSAQSDLALDVLLGDSVPRLIALDLAIDGEASIGSMVDRIHGLIVNAGATDDEVLVSANVGVSFAGAGEVGRDEPAHEVHVVIDHGAVEVYFDGGLYRPATLESLFESVGLALAAITDTPDVPIYAVPLLPRAALDLLERVWATGSADYPRIPLHRVFEGHVDRDPAAPAVWFGGEVVSYGDLDGRANRLAHMLVARGVGRGQAVGMCLMPSVEVLVTILAIFKAGGTYMPLDPTHPSAIVQHMLEVGSPVVVVTDRLRQSAMQHAPCPIIVLDEAPELASMSSDRPAVDVDLDWPSHLLFTSGTTGKPKGVLALHGNLIHYMQVARQRYGFRADDIFAAAARMTFSISLFEVLLPLCCGASVRPLERDEVLSGARLRDALSHVTVLHFGPSLLGGLFRHMRQYGGKLRPLEQVRHASTGGDMVPPQVIEDCKRAFPNAELFVIYGCTEVSCMGCTYPIDRDVPMTRTMVGKAFPDMVARLLDAHGSAVAPGVVGEICFSGKGLVTGYVGQPELTATKFAPFESERCYRTGDLGRLHTDGNIEILGRRDFQVQIRGIRIELAGIEHTIRAIGLAPQCAVIAKRISDDDRKLVAFVVDPKDATPAGFRRALGEHLPDYMLPSVVVVLDALPLTPNGKLDRGALERMPLESQTPKAKAEAGKQPTSALELAIAASFAKVLAIPVASIGLDDGFFDLGGDSLQLVMLVTELSQNVGIEIDPGALFERATVREIAELARKPDTFVPRPVLLSRDATKPPVFLLLGVQIYQELADRLGDEWGMHAVYSGKELRLLAEDDRGTSVTVQALAADYLKVIRTHQPRGPYRMLGLSFGGIVAYEVSQQLRAAGETVAFLGLIDSVLPLTGTALVRSLATRPVMELARGAVSRVRERLDRRLGKPVAAPEAAFVMPSDDARKNGFERRRQQAYRFASEAYMTAIRPLAQHVTLAVATRRLVRDAWQTPTCGLDQFVSTIDTTLVDSEHAMLLQAPAVDVIAGAFREALARTRT